MVKSTLNPESQAYSDLAETLRLRMVWLPYSAFALCMERLLLKLGYAEIKASSRHSLKGPNNLSGIDLIAYFDTGIGIEPTAVQLKRYKGPRHVPSRFVSELRGTMLERGIPQGLIISTTTFSEEGKQAAASFPGRPIRLIDGLELGRLMLEYRIGVIERTNLFSGETCLVFDEDSFDFVNRFAKGIKRKERR